ncbi:Meckel syndrome type 1 protein [Ooceraea biroi]|uniref:Meckel syndrome type 1 protein n=1 Tax=Ooceraea biroi TaxID=2015173 RepID=A0A026X1K2_OOCBI|nr:Meckel syndrome type 1 protein [Ooceraea biroi]
MSQKTGKMKIAASYKVAEPIHNLRIRVRVVQRRSPLAELLAEESEGGETRDSNFLEEEDRIFSWQEKVFSPFEIDFYADEKNCLTDCQREYHRSIRDEELHGARLYSYTENDSYYADDGVLTKPYRSYLSAKNQTALPAIQNLKPFRERYNKNVLDDGPTDARIRSAHYLYTERTTMYVMADLSRKDEPATGSTDSETLLCSVTYDKARKLLTVSPDFTFDDEHDDECHYSVTNSYGIKFNYRIEHVSQGRTSPELQEQREDTRREIQQLLAYKEAELHKEMQLAPANLSTIFLTLDIVSGHGFSYDGLFITYFMDLPQYWSTKQKDRLSGRTQKCRLERGSAHFSYCTDVSLHYPSSEFQRAKDNASSFWPRVLFSVASLDSWTRYRIQGYAVLSIPRTPGSYKFTVPTWRAKGNIVDRLRRFFIGGSHELEDITYCGIPIAHEGKVLDKSNLHVVPSGSIKINVNIVHQNGINRKHFNDHNSDKVSADALMNNVESVLEQFKAAKERMIKIRAMNL